ncbi:MAG TPA: histidine phosphatase family protein [Streptosporangiaceae bacterium]
MTASQQDQPPKAYKQRSILPPAGATDLLLVRHGQSQPYVEGTPFPLLDGHGDPPLSELGQQQAQRVGTRLADAGIKALYVTTLCRTAQTAAPLADRLGIEPRVEPGLREVHLGEWEAGLYRKMVAEQHPIVQRMLAEERWDLVPGAEPAAEFAERVQAAVARIAAEHPDERVVVFTHGGVIGEVLRIAARSRPFAFIGADNASVSRLFIADDWWMVRGFNDTAHLDGLV